MLLRQKSYSPFFQRFGRDVYIDAGCRFSHPHRIVLDDGVRINRDAIMEGSSAIYVGRNARIGHRFFLHSANHDLATNLQLAYFERSYIYKPIWIGDNVLISANVALLAGAHLGQGSFVAAGAVVPGKKFPDNSFLAGLPAKPIKMNGERPSRELLPAPAIAFLVSQNSKGKAAADLLASTLGLPQIAVFTDNMPLPGSVKVVICLDEGVSPPENIDEVWEISPAERDLQRNENFKINLSEHVDTPLPNYISYDIRINGFGAEPTLHNIALGHLFRTSNAYLKGTVEMRGDARAAWALCLLAGLTSTNKEDPSWDHLFKKIGSELIDPGLTIENWRHREQQLKVIFETEIEKFDKGKQKTAFFFGKPAENKITAIRRHFVGHPWLLPAFIWLNRTAHRELCEEILDEIAPLMQTAERLSCLGLSHRLLENDEEVANILATLMSSEWLSENAALLRVRPDSQTIDRSPPLVAFLADQLISQEKLGSFFQMQTKPVHLNWSSFANKKTSEPSQRTLSPLFDTGTRRFSKSLLDNWLAFQEIPKIESGHFYISDRNYRRPCQALETVWRDLISHALDRVGLPTIRIKPWPSGYDWALSIRYDVDRVVVAQATKNILRIQKEWLNSSCGSWYFLDGAAHNGRTQNVLKGWNQESAHHARLRSEPNLRGKGVTAHSAADSEYWRGRDTTEQWEADGALYGEAMLSSFPLPRPGWLGEKSTKMWLTPLHYPLEGSTKELSSQYFDQNLDNFREQIASGGLVIIGSHPDCNQDILDEILARENLEKVWAVPVNKAVQRVKALYAIGNVSVHAPSDDPSDLHIVSHQTLADVVIEICPPGRNGEWAEHTLQFQAGVGRRLKGISPTNLDHNS